jgi:hypothetical protein
MPKTTLHEPPLPGSTFSRMYKRERYIMVVEKTEEGVGYKVGKTIYRSPTAAAKSITKTEVNGWSFWGIETKARGRR